MGALQAQLRNSKMGPDEPVMSYCYDIIYLCSKVDPAMGEERKVQFIFQNMEPTLMQKVFPQMDRMDTAELFRRLQANPTPPTTSKDDIEKLVREEVTKSLGPIVEKLKQATRSLGNAEGSGYNSWMRSQGRGQSRQDRPNKRTVDGRPICNSCGKPGHGGGGGSIPPLS
jgi:hypothetical protein